MEVVCVWAGGVGALHVQLVTLHPSDFHFMDEPAKHQDQSYKDTTFGFLNVFS